MDLKTSLYLWARNSEERIQLLNDWLDDAIMKCATSDGLTVASTTTNGVAVSFMSDSLTLIDWIEALTGAIEMITNPLTGKRKAIQVFR